MTDEPVTTRRRVLLGVGATAATAALAGCAGNGGGGENDSNDTDNESDGMDNESMGNESDGMDNETDGEGNETDEEGNETDAGEMANVRVAHLSPDAPNVDVYVAGDPVLEDVAFGTVSDYLELAPDTYDLEITAAGDPETVVFEGEQEVAAADYTLAAVGELADDGESFALEVLEDDNSSPGSDTARVRAVHASPDAGAVDITTASDGEALFDGVEFGDAAYVEVPGGSYELEIRPDTEENDGEVVATFPVDVEGGGVYSAFAAGYLTPDDEPADTEFDLIVTEDAAP
ncbi:DUF4397 domain-containing protein [Halomarina ordinaria]|uniref:DUF4397 domain-containing protein n=1 Tax=Halomarina ordinaria TaxID=3033939 RepID=A0ABD5UBG0_9EURY|nr:DUF4397 domain-containing protein [Halomarina sp. PSRA2]